MSVPYPLRHGRACPGHPRRCTCTALRRGRDKPGHDESEDLQVGMTEVAAIDLAALAGPSHGALLRRRALAHKGLMIGATLLVLIVVFALLAPFIAPEDPYAQDLGRRLIPPVWYDKGSWAHLLGTDNLGRDYLSRAIYGARISLLIGVSVMAISGVIGTSLGLTAGYYGGRVDMAGAFFISGRACPAPVPFWRPAGRGLWGGPPAGRRAYGAPHKW